MIRLNVRTLPALLSILIATTFATAQEFPAKPIELIIPYGPGGSHDLTARALASVAHQYLGQPMLVVLKPGGGGAVGSQHVIRAKPDGYTLMLGGTGPNTIFALVQKAPIGPDHFASIARINYSPAIFSVRADAPWKTFREVLDYMKKNPGKFNFANTGPWGAADFPMRMVARAAGVEYNNIPFDGGGPALLAVLGGNGDASFLYTAQLLPQIAAGKMRALAVTDARRLRDLPNVPTLREEGVGVVFTQWRSVLAPRGIPQAISDKLEAGLKRATEDGSFQALVKQLGDEIHFQGAKEFEATWRKEWEAFAKITAGAQK
jgi:tripartite-type tricarboxylate transporter receptor subunit TctC